MSNIYNYKQDTCVVVCVGGLTYVCKDLICVNMTLYTEYKGSVLEDNLQSVFWNFSQYGTSFYILCKNNLCMLQCGGCTLLCLKIHLGISYIDGCAAFYLCHQPIHNNQLSPLHQSWCVFLWVEWGTLQYTSYIANWANVFLVTENITGQFGSIHQSWVACPYSRPWQYLVNAFPTLDQLQLWSHHHYSFLRTSVPF